MAVVAGALPLVVVGATFVQPALVRSAAAAGVGRSATAGGVKVGSGDGRFTADALAPAPSAPSPAAPPAAPAGVITRSGAALMLNGAPYRFTGVNAYELATQWGINAGCGAMLTDTQMDDFFASLRPNSLVRMWAWQGSLATNVYTHQRDWRPLDRVMAAANRHGQRLILSLAGQGGGCDDGHWRDLAWYRGGYRLAYDGDGTGRTPTPYLAYVREVVARYAGNGAVGMWEPMSEAEASDCPSGTNWQTCSGRQVCPDEVAAATAMRSFFDSVGSEIKRIDPVHLVESGLIGSGQCGTAGQDYQFVSASPGIDVLSVHDYGSDTVGLPGDQWNGEGQRVQQATAVNKPIIVGEMGIEALDGGSCASRSRRAQLVTGKLQGAIGAGMRGVLVWNWGPTINPGCTYDVGNGDPTMDVLRTFPLS